eukprot:m.50778 g.50778  ORF g.50778 m.50778 type:complete len:811 (-) comp6568_c0_seq1:663-3095(-)
MEAIHESLAWSCVQVDAEQVVVGTGGLDFPQVIVPAQHTGGPAFQRGTVSNVAALQKSLSDALTLSAQNGETSQALVLALPPCAARFDLESYCNILFETLGVRVAFLSPPWIAASMAYGIASGLVIHTEATATVIAPIIDMKVIPSGLMRVEMGGNSLVDPVALDVVLEGVFDALMQVPEAARKTLAGNIILSGAFPADFEEILADYLAERSPELGAVLVLSDPADHELELPPEFVLWAGLSVIGSLSRRILSSGTIDAYEGAIGVMVTQESYRAKGINAILSHPNADVLALTGSVGTVIPTLHLGIPCDIPQQQFGDEKWVCLHSDANCTLLGVCKQDSPKVVLPTSISGKAVIHRGVVKNWEALEAAWKTSFLQLRLSLPCRQGLLLSIPGLSTSADVERIVQIGFEVLQVPSMLLVNTWVAALMASGNETGIVVQIGDTATSIAPVLEFEVISHAATQLPFGAGEIAEQSVAKSIYQAVYSAIMKCPESIWPLLWSRIIVTGHGHDVAEFRAELPSRLERLALTNAMVARSVHHDNVHILLADACQGRNDVWVGLSVIGALCDNPIDNNLIADKSIGAYVTAAQYRAFGPGVVFTSECRGSISVADKHVGSEPTLVCSPAEPTVASFSNSTARFPDIQPVSPRAHLNSAAKEPTSLVYHQGWLTKQGGGTTAVLGRKNWKKRWFVLQGCQLTYHKSNLHVPAQNLQLLRDSSLGMINLLEATEVKEWKARPCGFLIETPARTYHLVATSDKERSKWIEQLRRAQQEGLSLVAEKAQQKRRVLQLQQSPLQVSSDSRPQFPGNRRSEV